jgi:hypothetical protein
MPARPRPAQHYPRSFSEQRSQGACRNAADNFTGVERSGVLTLEPCFARQFSDLPITTGKICLSTEPVITSREAVSAVGRW